MRRLLLALALAPSLAFAQAPQINDVQLRPGSSSLWGAAYNVNNNQDISQYNTAGSVVDSFRWFQGASPGSALQLWSIGPTGALVGAPTGSRQGVGTLNAQGLYVNGVAVATGLTPPGGSSGQVQYNNAGVFGGISGATSNGTALTLVAPILGTPASGTLTNTTGFPVANLAGAGTGVLTALATNVGSAGAPVLFNGAGGTPSSMTGTNITGTASGLTAGGVTNNAISNAMIRQGVARSVIGVTGNATANVADIQGTTANTVLAVNSTGTGIGFTAPVLAIANNTLGADVALNNVANYFDGPSVAQGSTGTWFASGTVTVTDTAGAANIDCKLWDGTTVTASARASINSASFFVAITLTGPLVSPAGNIRISCKDNASTSGAIRFNATGNSTDSTIKVMRIQ